MIGDAILFGIKRIDALRGDGHDSLVGPSPLVDLRAKEGYSLKDFLLVIFHTQFSTCFKSAVEAIRVNGEDPIKTATHKELTQIGPIFRFRWGRAHFPFSFLVCTEALPAMLANVCRLRLSSQFVMKVKSSGSPHA